MLLNTWANFKHRPYLKSKSTATQSEICMYLPLWENKDQHFFVQSHTYIWSKSVEKYVMCTSSGTWKWDAGNQSNNPASLIGHKCYIKTGSNMLTLSVLWEGQPSKACFSFSTAFKLHFIQILSSYTCFSLWCLPNSTCNVCQLNLKRAIALMKWVLGTSSR